MRFLRRPHFMFFTNALLAVMMLMVTAGSDARCFSGATPSSAQSQLMDDCPEMETAMVGADHSPQTHHSDENQVGMCHLGCPVALTAAAFENDPIRLHSAIYLRAFAPRLVGMNDIPQTPPPRFGRNDVSTLKSRRI